MRAARHDHQAFITTDIDDTTRNPIRCHVTAASATAERLAVHRPGDQLAILGKALPRHRAEEGTTLDVRAYRVLSIFDVRSKRAQLVRRPTTNPAALPQSPDEDR